MAFSQVITEKARKCARDVVRRSYFRTYRFEQKVVIKALRMHPVAIWCGAVVPAVVTFICLLLQILDFSCPKRVFFCAFDLRIHRQLDSVEGTIVRTLVYFGYAFCVSFVC